jgi:hypothetical protein
LNQATQVGKERAYRVQLYALSEERRVCGMTESEWKERHNEIWQICFGKDDKDCG